MELFSENYNGPPFEMFSASHLVALGLVLALNVFFFRWRNPSEEARRRISWIMAIVLVVNELCHHVYHAANGIWTVETMLPLHVCSLLVWLNPIMLIRKDYRFYEFSYFMGVGGALQALLTPDLGSLSFPHIRFFLTFISHGLLVSVPLYVTFVEGQRPTWKSLLRVAVLMNVYLALVFGLNLLLGSNYMFVAHKPDTASLIDVLAPWPWYILQLELIGVVMCVILYLPFAFKDWREGRVAQEAT